MSIPEDVMRRLIRITLLKIQNPVMRKKYHDILSSNQDCGQLVEWDAPVQRAIMGRTIEFYESEFMGEIIGTDKRLDEIVDWIFNKLSVST